MSAADPVLRVVVVTYSPGETLESFLTTLAGAVSVPYEVVLADNGSTDGAPEQAADAWPMVRLLRTGANLGYGGAANRGAQGAGTSWLLVANPDVSFDPGALDALLGAARRWPGAGALGPGIRTVDGQLYPSARALPSLGRGVAHALLGWWWPGNPWTRSYRQEQGAPVEGVVGWLSGSCLLLRREAFEAVGGFDEGYFMYFEDTDLGARLARAGWSSVYAPGAVVTHLGGHSTRRAPVAMAREHHASAYRYLARSYDRPWQAPLRLALRLGLGARYLASRASATVSAGARPTRSASALDDLN